jgi:hypothetical protein
VVVGPEQEKPLAAADVLDRTSTLLRALAEIAGQLASDRALAGARESCDGEMNPKMPAQTREGVAGKPKRVPRVWGVDQQMDQHRVARGKGDPGAPKTGT